MNIFELRFRLDEITYDLYIDSSNENNKRILINGKEVVDDHCPTVFTRNAHIAYYPIDLDGNELVILIDDNDFSHEYNVYLDGISILDKSSLNEGYNKAKSLTAQGFIAFCTANWKTILKNNLLTLLLSLLAVAIINQYTPLKIALAAFLMILLFTLILFALVGGEWIYYRNIVKNFHKRFKPKAHFRQKP